MKKLLGKILGKKEEPAPEEVRPLQRSPRVRIPLVDQALFVASNGKQYQIQNVSESGLALTCKGERFPDEVSGELRIGKQQAYVELLAVRRNGDTVGLTFGDGAAEVRGMLRRLFGEELHALSMTEVDASKQKPVENGTPRWFYAPGNFELFFVEESGSVTRFELEWNGTMLAWSAEGLRMGRVDRDFKEAVAHSQSALVQWLGEPTEDARVKALRIVENVPGLEKNFRDFIQGKIRG